MAILTADALAGGATAAMSNEATWNAVATGAGEALAGYTISANKIAANNWTGTRTLLWFDTSSLTSGAVISAAKIVHPVMANNTNTDAITIHLVTHTAPSTTIAFGDYDAVGSTSFGSVLMSGLSTSTTTDIVLNATGIAAINKTGNTAIALRTNKDIDNSDPTGYNEYTASLGDFDLVVTYTVPSSGFFALF
jgi:hypothetical protein